MAILPSSGIYGFLCSMRATGNKVLNQAGKIVSEFIVHFAPGFDGYGWKIWEYAFGKWRLEIDEIRVRGTFTAFELLVSKIRAIVGAQAITQACGKIKKPVLSEDGMYYELTLEDKDMTFVEHDFIRCQVFSGSHQKLYHVEIESIVNGVIRIPVSEFTRNSEGVVTNPPKEGDDIVQFGNASHDAQYSGRHSALYMHADETGQPSIDILENIYSKDWTGCLKVRMGGGIPGGEGARGFYCENGMIKGVDGTGHATYCIHPDGSAEFGDGSAAFMNDKSGFIAGGAIEWEWNEERGKCVCTMKDVVLTWDNLDADAKENLKGESGKDGVKGDPGKDGSPGVPGKDGISGKDGAPAVVYELMPSTQTISRHANGVCTPDVVSCGVRRTIGNDSTMLDSGGMGDEGITLYYSFFGGIFANVDPDTDISFSQTASYIHFELYKSNQTLSSYIVRVVEDGVNGTDGKDGTNGKDGTDGKDANLLPWVEDWNGEKTQIAGEWIVSPKMFSGTNSGTSENPVLTGIAIGRDCITGTNGSKRTGIFALVDNEVVFELDPLSKNYKFKGRVEADEGYFKGRIEAGEGKFTGEVNATSGIFQDCSIKACQIDENCIIKGQLEGATGSFSGRINASSGSIGELNITQKGNLQGSAITFENAMVSDNGIPMGWPIVPTGNEYIYSIVNGISYGNTFILCSRYTTNPPVFIVNLPSFNDVMSKCFASGEFMRFGGFSLKILVPATMTFRGISASTIQNNAIFRVTSCSGAGLIDNDGNNISYIELSKGDVLELYALYKDSYLGSGETDRLEYYIKSWRN